MKNLKILFLLILVFSLGRFSTHSTRTETPLPNKAKKTNSEFYSAFNWDKENHSLVDHDLFTCLDEVKNKYDFDSLLIEYKRLEAIGNFDDLNFLTIQKLLVEMLPSLSDEKIKTLYKDYKKIVLYSGKNFSSSQKLLIESLLLEEVENSQNPNKFFRDIEYKLTSFNPLSLEFSKKILNSEIIDKTDKEFFYKNLLRGWVEAKMDTTPLFDLSKKLKTESIYIETIAEKYPEEAIELLESSEFIDKVDTLSIISTILGKSSYDNLTSTIELLNNNCEFFERNISRNEYSNSWLFSNIATNSTEDIIDLLEKIESEKLKSYLFTNTINHLKKEHPNKYSEFDLAINNNFKLKPLNSTRSIANE